MRTLAVIPARFGSTRLAGKPLVLLAGVPVVVRTFRRVMQACQIDDVVVATDDERIATVVRNAGGSALITSRTCENGTIRVIEAVKQIGSPYDTILNVQGDEPMIDPKHIDDLLTIFREDPSADVGTLAVPIRSREQIDNPNVVKCVLNHHLEAMYFSRAPIPFGEARSSQRPIHLRHIGLYTFRRRFLIEEIPRMQTSSLETTEKLEQLRWLQHGSRIRVHLVDSAIRGVDTEDDLRYLEDFLQTSDNAHKT